MAIGEYMREIGRLIPSTSVNNFGLTVIFIGILKLPVDKAIVILSQNEKE